MFAAAERDRLHPGTNHPIAMVDCRRNCYAHSLSEIKLKSELRRSNLQQLKRRSLRAFDFHRAASPSNGEGSQASASRSAFSSIGESVLTL